MKKILSLCINLMLLIISDADPLKLVAGERSVVKKDGATHTISKYYVVPNDYDPNNATNTTAATQKSSLRIHSLHSKTMDSGSIDEEISKNKATTVNNQSDSDITVIKMNNQVRFRPYVNVGQKEVHSTESTVSMSTEQTLDSDDLGNLQVIPIYPNKISRIITDDKINTNVNLRKAVQNGSGVIVNNGTDYQDIEDAINVFIISKFGTAVRELYSQNLESFWKLIKINIDKELGDDKLLATIEQLSLLLNIFTNLYEAAQMHPVEKMINGIVEILQKPLVEKSNRHEFQAETNIYGDYDEECLRKCDQRSSKPQLDSNSTYLSEADSRQANDSLELENLERRQSDDSDSNNLIKMSDDPDTNEVTVSNNEPVNVLRGQLPVPHNVGVPDGYNVLFSTTTPTLNDVARYNDIQEDPNSIHTIPDSTETVINLNDQRVTVESRFADALPLTIKSKTADNLPWTMENEKIEYFPWPNPTTPNDGLTWHIEDKTSSYQPFTNVEQKNSDKVPWNIENKMAIKGIKTPYHIYTYVIKPTAALLKVPNAGNVRYVISRQPYENLDTTLYGLPTLHGGHKIAYKNQSPQSHYESQYSLSKPSIDINRQPSYSHHVTTTYDQSQTVNPSILHSKTPQEDNEHTQYLIGSEPNHKPALQQSNTRPLESQPNSGETPTVPEIVQISQHPGLISSSASSFTNTYGLDGPVYGGQIYQQPGAISTASANSKYTTVQNYNDVPTLVNGGNTNYYPGNTDEPVYGGQVYQQPGAIYTASANSKYTTVQNDNDVPTLVNGGDTNNYPGYIDEPVYAGQAYQQPGAISTASVNSKYTTVQNYNDVPTLVNGGNTNYYPGYTDEPVYGGQVYQQPGAISTASANSKYTTVQNDYDVPTLVNGGDTNNYPGYIDRPVYSGQVYQQPGAISTASANSKYTTVQNDYDVPTLVNGGDTNNYPGYIDRPVYGGQVYQQPGAISTASVNSKYTTVQNYNDVPTLVNGGNTNYYPGYTDEPVYGGQVYQQPGAISTASANSKYTTVQNDNNVPILVNGGDTNNYPGYISKATGHSEYTNVPIHYGHDTNAQPGLISEVHQYPVYPNVVDDFDDSILVNDVQIQKRPDYISKASAHSEFTLPVNYNDPTYNYEDQINIHPVTTQTAPSYLENPVNGGLTQNGDNYLVPYQPNGHTVHVIEHPSLIKTISGNQNLKLEPTYRLFTLQNLQKLQNAIIKTIQMHGPGVHDDRALINLKDIINIIQLLAEHLEETDGTNAWYEKIFYNSQDSQHPLQNYVYNLIRQRWLHELMLLLFRNNFSINILQIPGILSFLESWQFPKYVQNFMEAEELIHVPYPQNYNDVSINQNNLQDKFSTHTYDDLLEVPGDLAKYVTKNIIDNYKTHNEGIVLSIAGVEGEPDARAIIHILQNYLHNKNDIETQENVIIRDNKLDMLKQITLFLREKGYGRNTIANLIRKLYTAVNLTERQGCKTHHTNFAKNMYDVILPVLRRSGQ